MNIDQWLQCIRVCCVNGIMMLLMWDHVLIGYVYGIMYKLCLCLWDHVYYLDGLVLMGSCLWIGIMPEVTFLLRGCWSHSFNETFPTL